MLNNFIDILQVVSVILCIVMLLVLCLLKKHKIALAIGLCVVCIDMITLFYLPAGIWCKVSVFMAFICSIAYLIRPVFK